MVAMGSSDEDFIPEKSLDGKLTRETRRTIANLPGEVNSWFDKSVINNWIKSISQTRYYSPLSCTGKIVISPGKFSQSLTQTV